MNESRMATATGKLLRVERIDRPTMIAWGKWVYAKWQALRRA